MVLHVLNGTSVSLVMGFTSPLSDFGSYLGSDPRPEYPMARIMYVLWPQHLWLGLWGSEDLDTNLIKTTTCPIVHSCFYCTQTELENPVHRVKPFPQLADKKHWDTEILIGTYWFTEKYSNLQIPIFYSHLVKPQVNTNKVYENDLLQSWALPSR